VDIYGIKAGRYMNRLTKDIHVGRYGMKAGRYMNRITKDIQLKSGVRVILRKVSLALGHCFTRGYTEIKVEEPEK
jgi:hypothetical protein